MSNLADFETFFRRKPTGYNISNVQKLRPFIDEYPDEDLTPNLMRLEGDYKYYRAIHGDGNCFYRAIMFLYLREAELGNYEKLFPHADLFTCKKMPFQNPKRLTSDALLEYAWQRYLLPLADLRPLEREKELEKLINSSVNFDSILIGYFRALNYDYLLRNRAQFQTFSYGGFEEDLQRIITFGKESEGLELFTLALILDAKITVLMVHRDAYQKILYNQDQKNRKNYVVSYRPGHYDIPSNDEQYIKSKSPQKDTFYDHLRETTDSGSPFDLYTPGDPYQSRKSEAPAERKKANSYKPEVIIIKKPSQLLRISGPPVIQSQKKKPGSMTSFGRSYEENSNNRTPSRVTTAVESRALDKPVSENKNVTKIRSSFNQHQQRDKRQRIVFQSTICIGVIALIVLGLVIV